MTLCAHKKYNYIPELIIVVSIVGALSAIAIPNFLKFRCRQHGSKLGLNNELTIAICTDCANCDAHKISPKDVLDMIAAGNADPKTFLNNDTLQKLKVDGLGINVSSDKWEDPCSEQNEKINKLQKEVEDLHKQLSITQCPLGNLTDKAWKH